AGKVMMKINIFRAPAVLLMLAASSALFAQSGGAGHELAVSENFQECRNCPQMVVLPAGEYLMGSPPDEPERRDNEAQRRITFASPFAMSTTPVTWNQWEACMRDRWCDGEAIEQALRQNLDGTPNENYRDYGRGTRPMV